MPYLVKDHHRIFYHAVGNDGPPLIFLHGAWLDHRMWRRQQEHFGSAFRTVAYDLGCHGRSSFPPGKKCSVAHWSDQLALVVNALFPEERVHVCGLSLGGMIALHWAHHHPDRVAGLVLVDSPLDFRVPWWLAPPFYGGGTLITGLVRMLPFPSTMNVFLGIMQMALSKRSFNGKGSFGEYVRECMIGMGKKQWLAVWNHVMHYRGLPTYRPPATTGLIIGEHDHRFVRWKMKTFARQHRFPLITIPRAGHMANIENPAAFNRALAGLLNNTR